MRNKHPKRRVKAKLREDREEAAGPNGVWAIDLVMSREVVQPTAGPALTSGPT